VNAKIAWIFPGQGAQEVGMGRAVFEASAAARDVFERADRSLGFSLSTLCFEGPVEELTLTANTQPALLVTSTAILAALREAVPELPLPAFAAGHSLGEYSALVAAGALTLEDAARLVRLRGTAMQEAVPAGQGAMAAIMGLSADELRAVCVEAAEGEAVGPANWNGPGQVVIAGHAGAVARASALATARKGKAIALKVSAPFHSALMAPAARRMEQALCEVNISPLVFPVIANIDGEPNSDPAGVRTRLVRQVDGAVEWQRTVERLVAEGVTLALELGPGKVLAGLVKRIDKSLRVINVSDPAGFEAARAAVLGSEAANV
jgi:[acyl-carrier-protein] S-malonyltransferase